MERRALNDFTSRPRYMPEGSNDGPSLGERLHIAVGIGVLSVAAFAKQAIEFGREVVAAITEPPAED